MMKAQIYHIGFWLTMGCLLMIACKNAPSTNSAAQAQGIPNDTEVKEKTHVKAKKSVAEKNALEVAQSLPDFSILVKAIEAADVATAVTNEGPLAIFAPTNKAFEKLPEGTLEDLLKPENKQKLAYILTNHVAPANYYPRVLKKHAKEGRKLFMASGEYVPLEWKDNRVYIQGIPVQKEVKVSNGWIYVIDDIIMPKNMPK